MPIRNDISFQMSHEQGSLLKGQNYTLRPLANAGSLNFLQVLAVSWQPILIFVAATWITAFMRSTPLLIIALAILMVFPLVELLVLVVGVLSTGFWSRVVWRAVMFWSWWPFWKFAVCLAAAVGGCMLGSHFWQTTFMQEQMIHGMQTYQNVLPNASSIRLQDAGTITWEDSAGVNRFTAGCFKNGYTACVAPLVKLDESLSKPATTQPKKSYDIFMVGADCCSCHGDFRCGDWDSQEARVGGIRVLNDGKTEAYRLAAQDYYASMGMQPASHPIFFEWHNNPTVYRETLLGNAHETIYTSILASPVLIILFMMLLSGILLILQTFRITGPQELAMPKDGLLGKLSQTLHPGMSSYQSRISREQTQYVSF